MKFMILVLALATVVAAQCPKYKFVVFLATSKNAAGLEKIVAKYRKALGGKDNGSEPGPIKKGHRSINWDAAAVPFDMPGNFFDETVTRGALFKTKTGEFRVSNPEPNGVVDDRFDSILPKVISKMFVRFSLFRLFTPLNSNKMKMLFKVPAMNKKATTSGFGAVFTDVDKKGATNLKYFDKKGCLIAKVNVPPRNKGLSFAGIVVVNPKNKKKTVPAIARVKFKLGTISVWDFARKYVGKIIGDVVVLDDFIYGEPQPW